MSRQNRRQYAKETVLRTVRSNQTSGFTLTYERRCSGDDGLGTGDVHRLEEEPSKLANNPLHHAEVVHPNKGRNQIPRGPR